MRILILLLFSLILGAKEVIVATSANLSFVMPELIKTFSLFHPNISIKSITASSGKLTAQIEKGAPFELFLSADMKYPSYLYQKGLTLTRPLVYAQGKVVFISKKISSLSLLPTLKKIAIPNPKTAPYGKATKEFLQKNNLWEEVKQKAVFGESVAQTLSYALRVDGGFISSSALYAPKMQALRKFAIPVDTSFINQGVVLLKGASPQAKEFFIFLFSKEAAKVLKEFGYNIP